MSNTRETFQIDNPIVSDVMDSLATELPNTVHAQREPKQPEALVQDLESAEKKFEDDSRELAFESLYTLQMYLSTLCRVSARIPDERDEAVMKADFNRLLEGIELLNETVLATREVLKARKSNDEQLLEADLFSILTDLLEANETSNILYRDQLLREYLPQNLSEWKEKAIPQLIRSADS